MEELHDIVNEYDEVIGQKQRSDIYIQKLGFRVINAFIMNDRQQLWIPRRTQQKKLFPLCLDASVGGHVMAGETYDHAFVRELKEELNIDANLVNYQMIAKLTPQHDHVSAFMQLYLIYSNATPEYNKADFCESFWIDIPTLQNTIKAGESTKGDLPILINAVRSYIQKNIC